MISLEEAQGRSVEPEEFRIMIESDAKKMGAHPGGQDRMAPPQR